MLIFFFVPRISTMSTNHIIYFIQRVHDDGSTSQKLSTADVPLLAMPAKFANAIHVSARASMQVQLICHESLQMLPMHTHQ